MTEKEIFFQKLKKAGLLSGQLIDKEIAEALFDELKDEHKDDIVRGLRDIAYSGEKINLGNLWKYILSYKIKRIEEEARLQKEQEKKEINEMMKKEGIPEEVKIFLRSFR